MTPEEEAYNLAKERIAEAKADGWKFIDLSGEETKYHHGNEERWGDPVFQELVRLPSALSKLRHLERFDCVRTKITDITPIQGLTGLQTLHFEETQVSDLMPIQALTGLRSLVLSSTKLSDLTPIQGLTGLQTLVLSDTQLSDLTPIQGLIGLQTLYLESTQVSDLTPIQGLIGLQRLYLGGTQVRDLTPIQRLSGLQRLYLNNAQVSDLTPIQGLSGLQELNLDSTQVRDLTPIQGLTGLQTLYLEGTPLLENEPALQQIYAENQGAELVRKILDWQQSWIVDVQTGTHAGSRRAASKIPRFLNEGTIRVGRDQAWADLVFPETSVSRQHAIIAAQGSQLSITDLNSQNGVYLNGKRIATGESVPFDLPKTVAFGLTEVEVTRVDPEAEVEPEPEPGSPPVEDLPEQQEDLAVVEADGKLEVKPGALTPEEQSDPLRRKLHERLIDRARALLPFGNQFYRLDPKVRRLVAALDCPFEDLDFVDIYLELEELRVDFERDNDRREDPYSEELLSVIATVLNTGGALVIGVEDVDKLEARRLTMLEEAGPMSDEAARDVARLIIGDPKLWGEKLRTYLEIINGAEPAESERLTSFNFALVRNAMISLAKFLASKPVDGALTALGGAAAMWIVANPDAALAFAQSMTNGDWLTRVVHWIIDLASRSGGGPIP